ncbi:MAG: mandelate racemase/muconate lactonizing enzyme family protein, partial [Saccharolobus sp.]
EKPGIGVDVNEKMIDELKVKGEEYFNPEEPVWVVKGTWKD